MKFERKTFGHLGVLSALASLALSFSALVHAGIPADQVEFFEKRIRPILAQECYECHSVAGKKKGGLVLDSRDGWKSGGNSGDVIIPGKPGESLLIKSIRHEEAESKMPKNGAKLDAQVIADFEKWIVMGAPDPRDTPPSDLEAEKGSAWPAVLEQRRKWWSFQPVANPALPSVKDNAWSEHPVDRFLLARMEREKLQPSGNADPRVFFRRLNFVLTGLPPKPEEIDAFAADFAKNEIAAVESAVDRLLASPRFGETWARHWMDWMRYADTHGSEGDPAIPHAWRYRDYLIRALNADVPYAQMVREHIAGDLLENPRINKELGINESALAPAHFRMVLHGFTPTDALDEQVTFVDNQIDTVTKAFLGVTVSCARCHNHKFDPISQTDFYALYGIFNSGRPALIDVNLPERKKTNIEQLASLKERILAELASAWQAKTDAALGAMKEWKIDKKPDVNAGPLGAWARLSALPPEKWKDEWQRIQKEWGDYRKKLEAFRAQDTVVRWDLRTAESKAWVADGPGAENGPSPAGEFAVLPSGERILSSVLPSGTYSHLLSDKHRGLMMSPAFQADGGKIWLRVRGEHGRLRYVVQNYPRSGLIYPKQELKGGGEQWVNWPLDYWKGDTVHLEIATDGDQPVEVGTIERSWFGIAEVLYAKNANAPAPPAMSVPLVALLKEGQPAPESIDDLLKLYAGALQRCVTAFSAKKMSDDEAEFLSAFVRQKFLPVALADVPAAAPLVAEYRKLEAEIPQPTRVPGLQEGFASDQALFTRGDHKKPEAAVKRRFLEALDPKPYNCGSQRSGRRELAESIVAASNPLTHRVIVNRLWHHIFGRGIVKTPDNFGRLGETPSHPELLDYLAARLATDGGSLKKMVRLLVTSRTFRLSHVAPEGAAEKDPENALLTHFRTHRLDAEAIRDSMIALSGKLDLTIGGAPVDGGTPRRSVYLKVVRNNLDPLLTAFDFPVPSATRGNRDATNVPAQALTLLNAGLVQRWANDWVARVLSQTPADDARVKRMFAEAFGRAPTPDELSESLSYIQALRESSQALLAGIEKNQNATKEEREQAKAAASNDGPWRSFAQALLNAKEFIYVR